MSLSTIKLEILQSMLLIDKPTKAMDIAKEAKKDFQPVMMHLLGLQKMGFVSSPEKGLYVISTRGKKALGIHELTKDKATTILGFLPHDQAFNFYTAVDQPLNMHSHNVRDFVGKIQKIDTASLEFHFNRGDFENWFKGLGDDELAKKVQLLRKQNLTGEALRTQLHSIVENRYQELTKLSGQLLPEDKQSHIGQGHTHP